MGLTKVRKVAKIKNQYNQVPHLTQDTNTSVVNLSLHEDCFEDKASFDLT